MPAEFFMRFTIRDLLWLMVIVACCAGWVVDGIRQRDTATRLRAVLTETESQLESTEDKLENLLTVLGNRGEQVTFSGSTITIHSGNGASVHGSMGWPK
jgi:hypothetical protein